MGLTSFAELSGPFGGWSGVDGMIYTGIQLPGVELSDVMEMKPGAVTSAHVPTFDLTNSIVRLSSFPQAN